MKKKDSRFFQLAEKQAKLSTFHDGQLGCVVVHKNKIVCEGHNSSKTHPLQKIYNEGYRCNNNENDYWSLHSLHAEMTCLIEAEKILTKEDFSKASLYVCRIRKITPYGLARPCPACMKRIKELGIKHIYYTTNDGFAEEEIA